MNCLSLNIQGASCLDKRGWVKSLCHKFKINVLAVQETKMELIDFLVVRSFWGNASFCYAYSPSRGNAGGILVIWDQNRFNKKRAISSDWFVAVEGVWISSGTEVVFVSVYALQGTDSKRQLWGEIGQLMSSCLGEFVIMGDFNEVRDESERMGSQFYPASARVFN